MEAEGLSVPESTINNLEKFDKDVVYLKHQNKMHIFPVDNVYVEDGSIFECDSGTNKEIFNNHIKQSVQK